MSNPAPSAQPAWLITVITNFPTWWKAAEPYVSTLIIFLFGLASDRIYSFFKKRSNFLVRLLHFQVSKVPIHFTYGLVPPSGSSLPYYMLEEGDVTGLYSMLSLFTKYYSKEQLFVLNHKDIQSSLSDIKNIVSISGPVWNNTTELLLGYMGSPVYFEPDNSDLKDTVLKLKKANGDVTEFVTEYVGNHRPKQCYGVLIGGEFFTPLGREQSFLLCAGSSNLSTFGSTIFLQRIAEDKKLAKELKSHKILKQKKWAIIIRIQNWTEGGTFSSDIPPIKKAMLNINIEKILLEKDFLESYEYHYNHQ